MIYEIGTTILNFIRIVGSYIRVSLINNEKKKNFYPFISIVLRSSVTIQLTIEHCGMSLHN